MCFLPAVVVLQTIKVWVHSVGILPVGQDEIGMPVQALSSVLCHADHTSVALAVAHIAVGGSCNAGGVMKQTSSK